METLKVNLAENSYNIFWESNPDEFKSLIANSMGNHKNYVITNDMIYKIYENEMRTLFPNARILIINEGEEHKNLLTIKEYSEKLLSLGANRTSVLWAFGGGVIGDITGFLASIYMRGIRYYQIPTTLLSMVDSSVGGKTGVNIEGGKNMIGTFYQPSGVFINASFLKTLSEREYKCGLSEVLKSALLNDPALFNIIEKEIFSLNTENVDLNEKISLMSVRVKADVVSKDEKETSLRAILNFGHTLAHALESYYKYKVLSHGESVSIGMSFAAFMAVELGILNKSVFERIQKVFENLKMMYKWSDLPTDNLPDADILIELMKGDKKNLDNEIRFIFINDLGKFLLPQPVDIPKIKVYLEKFTCL